MPILGIIASSFRSAAGPTGAYDSLATVTLSAATASITFAGIPTGYKHLQIRGIARNTAAGTGSDYILLKPNSDTGSNFTYHWLYGTGSAAGAAASAPRTTAPIGTLWESGVIANDFSAVICDILDYGNTNKYKTIRSLGGGDTNGNSYQEVNLFSNLWMSTSAINQLEISSSTGNLAQYSQFALYGIK